MPTVGYAEVLVKPSFKGTQGTIAKHFDPAAGAAGESAGRTMGSRMRGALAKTAKVGAAAAGVAVGAALVGGFKSAMNQQNSQKILGGLYGSVKEAKEMMASLREVAKDSPVKYDTYLKAAETLAYAGVKGDEATESLKNVGKAITAAGGTDEDMNRATDSVLKMVNAGKVTLLSLQQLSGSGVPIISGLAKHFGKSTEEINKMASDGKVGLEDVLEVMQKGTGDTFQSMIKAGEEASQSFGNQWKIAKDNVVSAIGENMIPMLDKLGPLMGKVGAAVAASIGKIPGAFAAAGKWAGSFMGGIKDVASSVSDFLRPAIEKLGIDKLVTAMGEKLPGAASAVGDAFRDASKWISENGETLGRIAGWIGVVMIPAFVRLGIAAVVSSAKQVWAWAASAGGSAKAAAMYVINSYKIIGTWVSMGLAAIKSGAETVAIWLMYRVESAKAVIAMLASKARIVGAWVAMGAAAVASGIKTAAVWTGTIIKQAVTGAISFGLQVAKVVAGWVLMGVQSLIQAAKMAAAWVLAMGPVGWVIVTVVALVALIIANWDKVKSVTVKIFKSVSKFLSDVWRNIKTAVVGFVLKLVVAAINHFVWMRDKVTYWFKVIKAMAIYVWTTIRDKVVGFVVGLVKKVVDKFVSLRNKVSEWFGKIKDLAIAVWTTIRDKVVAYVVSLVKGAVDKFISFRDKVKNIFNAVKDFFISVWRDKIKPVFQAIGDFVTKDIPAAFRKGVDIIKKVWAKVANVARKPINFVIDTVYNNGLKKAFNGIANKLDLPDKWRLPPASKVPAFARGGHTGPGSKYQEAGVVHADEFVFRKEATNKLRKRIGLAGLDHMNRTGEMPDGYSSGGLVRRPVGGRVTSGFGAGRGRYPHAGIDFAVPVGTAVRAALDGVVQKAGRNVVSGRTGIGMLLGHDGGRNTYYGHLSRAIASVGDRVTKGQKIANSGNTGNSTGPHLHFETWSGGKPLNPAKYLGGDVLPKGAEGGGESGGGDSIFDFLNPLKAFKGKMFDGLKKKFGDNMMVQMGIGAGKKGIGGVLEWIKDKGAGLMDNLGAGVSGFKNAIGLGSTKDKVRSVAKGYGWNKGDQWKSLSALIQKESGWDLNAANPSSSARGLFQKMTSLHGSVEKTAGDQAGWGLNYIKGKYGNPVKAWDYWQRNHHYADGGQVKPYLHDSGGVLNPGLSQIVNNSRKPEAVLNNKQWSDISMLAGRGASGDTFQFTVPDRATAQDYFDEARFQSRRKARGGVSV